MKTRRIILDTNLWISFLITKDFKNLDNHLTEGDVSLLFSEQLFAEFIEVSKRPKLKKYFKTKDISALLTLMNSFSEMVEVKSNVDLCRDKKDNFILNLAIDSNANFLVTGDKDLLELKKVNKTKIITFTDLALELDK